MFHPIITCGNSNYMKNVVVFLFTYRLELWCDVEKTLLLARPAAAAVSTLSGRACSAGACAAGGSPAARPPSAEITSGRLHGLQTRVGAAPSSSSLSSTTQRSRRRFGARVLEAEPWPVKGPGAASAGATRARDGSPAIGLLPATLSLLVGAGHLSSSSLQVYRLHRVALSIDGSTLARCCMPGASDIYTDARSMSPICKTKVIRF